ADSDAFYRSDIAFHGVFYQIAGNPIFPAIHQGFVGWLSPHWERMPRARAHNERNFLAHRAIYDAILERDPDRAEAALVHHLETAWSIVEDTIMTAPPPPVAPE
ncbi:MAG: FCD domain-containing protein, partial [Pseudomonadota bacterium]